MSAEKREKEGEDDKASEKAENETVLASTAIETQGNTSKSDESTSSKDGKYISREENANISGTETQGEQQVQESSKSNAQASTASSSRPPSPSSSDDHDHPSSHTSTKPSIPSSSPDDTDESHTKVVKKSFFDKEDFVTFWSRIEAGFSRGSSYLFPFLIFSSPIPSTTLHIPHYTPLGVRYREKRKRLPKDQPPLLSRSLF